MPRQDDAGLARDRVARRSAWCGLSTQRLWRRRIAAPAPVLAGWDIRDGYRAAQAVLRRPDPPTGLVCADDRVAVGAVLAAREHGLDVPRDLSIVGYDDDENVAGVMVPALTTVAIPHQAMGIEGMRRLLAATEGDVVAKPGQVQLPCPLIERESVAAPRT